MKKFIIPVLIFLMLSVSCKQWKVSSLKKEDFTFIKNGDKPGDVKIITDEYALENLSFSIGVFNDSICIVDNYLKRVQIIDADNNVKLVLGNIENVDSKKINTSNFNFNVIGSFAIDSDDNIYIQNRFPQLKNFNKKNIKQNGNEDINFSPSYILVFNDKGNLQYTLGQLGTPDIPFYYIDNLAIDDDGRLFVVTRSFNTWSLFRFNKNKRELFINLGEIEFKESEGKETFKGKIENVKIYNKGDKIIISVAYYHGLRLKFRKLFEYNVEEKKISRAIIDIPDPRNVLFDLIEDKHIYLWDMDGKDVKFMIYNMQGNIVNVVGLNISYKSNYYSKIISDGKGKIYSYHATKKGIKIFKWN